MKVHSHKIILNEPLRRVEIQRIYDDGRSVLFTHVDFDEDGRPLTEDEFYLALGHAIIIDQDFESDFIARNFGRS